MQIVLEINVAMHPRDPSHVLACTALSYAYIYIYIIWYQSYFNVANITCLKIEFFIKMNISH